MLFQSLDSSQTILKKYLRIYPSAKLLTLYRQLRKRPNHSAIGCWPIIFQSCLALTNLGKTVTLPELVKVCKSSEDPELHKVRVDSQIVRNLINKAGLKRSI